MLETSCYYQCRWKLVFFNTKKRSTFNSGSKKNFIWLRENSSIQRNMTRAIHPYQNNKDDMHTEFLIDLYPLQPALVQFQLLSKIYLMITVGVFPTCTCHYYIYIFAFVCMCAVVLLDCSRVKWHKVNSISQWNELTLHTPVGRNSLIYFISYFCLRVWVYIRAYSGEELLQFIMKTQNAHIAIDCFIILSKKYCSRCIYQFD